MGKNNSRKLSKNLSSKYSQKLLHYAEQSATYALKTASKRSIQKQQKQLVIWLVIKLLIELQKFQKNHNRIIQKKLEIKMIKKYLKKDIYLQNKDKKLLMWG